MTTPAEVGKNKHRALIEDAQAVRQAVAVEGYLVGMQELVAGTRASRGEVGDLAEEVEALRALVAGLMERDRKG